jgi:hypothetical protein
MQSNTSQDITSGSVEPCMMLASGCFLACHSLLGAVILRNVGSLLPTSSALCPLRSKGKVILVMDLSNWAPSCEGVWICRYTILDFGASCRWAGSFTPQPPCLRENTHLYPLDRRLYGLQRQSGHFRVETSILPLPGIEPRLSSR